MSLLRIAWRSLQRRGLASVLTTLAMSLGVLLVVAVLLVLGIVSRSFQNNSSLGFNVLVGAKGGKLQLVLNSIYYLSSPVENVDYRVYEDFLPASERPDGKVGAFAEQTQHAIPICMGDYFEGFRVVGTTPEMFAYEYDSEHHRKYEFSAGRNFQTCSAEHGFYEAVVGSVVAKQCKLQPGSTFAPTHGPEGDTHDAFFIVGVLKPTGTPKDRAVFVNIEGFYLLAGHAQPLKPEDAIDPHADAIPPSVAAAVAAVADNTASSKLDEQRRKIPALRRAEREVTAILVRTINGLVSQGLRNAINEGNQAQAVFPIQEIDGLLQTFVVPFQWLLLAMTILICIISGVSILVSIYNSMNDRRHEIAVMRALGAGRGTVMSIVLIESILLAVGGGLLGWIGGHVLVGGVASSAIEDATGVHIGLLDLAPDVDLLGPLGAPSFLSHPISSEFFIIPGLIILAVAVGVWPAMTAYRTDVVKALSATP
jgi:putative ABC transport system permease protein